MSKDLSFEEFKKMLRSFGSSLEDADSRLLRQAAEMDDEATAKQFLIDHEDECSPVLRAAIVEGVINEVENATNHANLKSEANILLAAAYKDVEWFLKDIDVEELKQWTPSLITGFINEYLERHHTVPFIKAALNGLNVWYRGE